MEYRKLGNTDLELSAITYGSFAIGGTMWGGTEKKQAIASIRASIAHGATSIDTAPFYGFGLSEELIGEAIKGMDRSKIQILTKFGLVWDGSNQGRGVHFFDHKEDNQTHSIYQFSSKENIIKEVEESLRRLNTDYIDLIQQHWPDSTTPIDETMEAMELLIRQGKVRAAGVSNYSLTQLEEASKTLLPASNQVSYSMLNRGIETELTPFALAHKIGIIAYSPMERGLLSGKYFEREKLKETDHRNGYFQQFDLNKVKILLDELTPIAEEHRVSLAQLVIRWTSLQPGITTVLAGARNEEQAISNAQAMDIQFSESEIKVIEKSLLRL